MNQITCVFDACSIINLIHIDEDDFLLRKLSNIDLFISQEVFKEISGNVFSRLNKYKDIPPQNLGQRKIEIDHVLNFYRAFQITNETIEYELKPGFIDHVQTISGYSKRNGEFYSTVLALFLSRCKGYRDNEILPAKLFFLTDDAPAKRDLDSFFITQQIGHIEDTADLLILLYRIEDRNTFGIKDLDKYLSKLFQEYALEVRFLEKKLKAINENLSLALRRNRGLKTQLDQLIWKLSKLDFKGMIEHFEFFESQKRKYRSIYDTLHTYKSVFELDSNANNLLLKIQGLRKEISNIYRM